MKTITHSTRRFLLAGLFTACAILNAQTDTIAAPVSSRWRCSDSAAVTPAALQPYTRGSLQGNYGLSESGSIGQAPYVSSAILTLDGAGNVTGLQNFATGAYGLLGNTVTGTYSVTSTGFGSMALSITASDGSGTITNANYSLVVTSRGAAIERADNGVLAAAQLKPQASTTFSNASANGLVVMQEQGYAGGGPFSLLATLALDGNGNVTGTATYTTVGEIYSATVTGIYTLNANGTGSAVLSLNGTAADGTPISSNLTYAINMVDTAGTAYAMSMDPGTTAIATVSAR